MGLKLLVDFAEKIDFRIFRESGGITLVVGQGLLDDLDVWLGVQKDPFVGQRKDNVQSLEGGGLFGVALIFANYLEPDQTLIDELDRDDVLLLMDLRLDD